MPHIRLRGARASTVAHLSLQAEELAKLVKTEAGHFTFESVQTVVFENGQVCVGSPFVEVLWFPRNRDIKDAVAAYLTAEIRKIEPHDYITVAFYDLKTDSYYENGQHF